MKTIVVLSLLLAVIAFSTAEDDGQYRPELYGGDDGQYRPLNDGRYFAKYYQRPYYSYLGRSGRVNSQFEYNPYFYSFTPYQPILTPFVSYNGDPSSIDQSAFASSVRAVSARPPVPSVAAAALPLPATRAAAAAFATTPKPVNYNLPVYARQYYHTAEANANIVRQVNDINTDSYHYLYQTDNGINAEETGRVSAPNGGTRASGFYEYIGDDGLKYRVDYTADENGFRPIGAHLP